MSARKSKIIVIPLIILVCVISLWLVFSNFIPFLKIFSTSTPSINVANENIELGAGQSMWYTISTPPDAISPTLVGTFQVANGETISVQVLKKEECPSPVNSNSCVAIYSIPNRDNGNMQVSLESGKEYYLLLENNAILFPSKTVEINFEIRFGSSQIKDPIKNNQQDSNSDTPTNTAQLIERLTTPSVSGAEMIGNSRTGISIIEFGDYQDPYSAAFNRDTKNILLSKFVDTGIVNFGFKNLVINDLPDDKLSTYAAEAAYCAAEQNKYWEYHDKIYNNSKSENTGWITRTSLIDFATGVNIPNITKFTECLDSSKYNDQVTEDSTFSKNIGLGSTPTFLLIKDDSSKIAAIEGAQPIKVFEDVINQILNGTL